MRCTMFVAKFAKIFQHCSSSYVSSVSPEDPCLFRYSSLKMLNASIMYIIFEFAEGRHFCSSGDNMLTAVSVARDCEMIDELDRIVIVSAKPPSTSSTAIINPSTTTQVPSNGNSQNGTEVGFVANRFTTSSAAYGLPAECLPEQNSEPLVEFHYAEDLHKPVTEVTTTDGVSSRHWQTHDRRTTAHVLPGLRRDKRPKIGWPRKHAQHSIAWVLFHGTVEVRDNWAMPYGHKSAFCSPINDLSYFRSARARWTIRLSLHSWHLNPSSIS